MDLSNIFLDFKLPCITDQCHGILQMLGFP